MVKGALLFIGGVIVGSVGSYFYLKKKHEDEVNAEIEEVVQKESSEWKRKYDDLKSSFEELAGQLTAASEAKKKEAAKPKAKQKLPVTETAEIAPMDDYISDKVNYAEQYEPPAKKEAKTKKKAQETAKLMITKEQFDMECPHYAKEELDYFDVDHILADSSNKVVDISVIGKDALKKFGDPKHPRTIYVRDDFHEVDYEVYLEHGAYDEDDIDDYLRR